MRKEIKALDNWLSSVNMPQENDSHKKIKKDTGIYKYMDCSTGHITEADASFLSGLHHHPLIIRWQPYGYWINVPSDIEYWEETVSSKEISEPIKAILIKAKENGCNWINLDRDGFVHEDLETFDW